MKTFIPKNIQGGMFNMNIQLGPLNITMVQLFILAIGIALSLALWNSLVTNGMGKVPAFIFALPLFMIFLGIAFFKWSELTLLPFIAKMIRTYFLDETRKFQNNFKKIDKVDIIIKKSHTEEKKSIIEQKEINIDKSKIDKLSGF